MNPTLPPTPFARPMTPAGGRRGGAYIAVLGIGLLVVTVGVGALASARVRARGSDLTADAAEARTNARAAIELGRAFIARNSNWRTARANGAWATAQAFGNGTFSLTVQNPTGVLDRSDLDSVILTGTGVKGAAVQNLSVQLDAVRTPLSCLSVPMSSGGLVTLNLAAVSTTSGPITSNAGVTSVLATINCDVEACAAIIGTGFKGKTSTGVDARQLPDSTVAAPYIAAGASIPISSLPASLGVRYLRNAAIGPRLNPFGAPNASGIYVIDCQNQPLTIESCRIIGTLVILNPGLGSQVRGSNHWAPAVENYPSLIVMGDFAVATSDSALSEASAGVNFNPTGLPHPYPSGASNSTLLDTYSSVIDGMVYISGNATSSSNPSIDLLIVGGTCGVDGTLKLDFDPKYAASPPPGFYTAQMQVAQGSWRRVVTK